jgi:hypothetical protein
MFGDLRIKSLCLWIRHLENLRLRRNGRLKRGLAGIWTSLLACINMDFLE